MTSTVRSASLADLPFIAEHFEETIALWEDYVVTEETLAKQRANIQEWLVKDEMHVTVAVDAEGRLQGFNTLYVTKDYSGSPLGKIIILYVLPEHRGAGLARALKVEGEAWLKSRGVKQVVTEIDAKNERMLAINQRAGFRLKSCTFVRDL